MSGCSPAGPDRATDVLHLSAAFYPLQFVAERVGGAHVRVTNLTAVGAEPHDVELSARDLVGMREADLILYLAGLAPAVDEGVRVAARANALDVAEAAGLHDEVDHDAGEPDGGSASEEGHTSGDGHDHGADTHFWLDPIRLANVAAAVADRLGEIDPAHASEYAANAASLADALRSLDGDLASGLANCASRDLVTSHSAFGFLASRYDLREWGIVGIAPDAEPTANALAEIADLVRARGVRTVYTETLVSGDVARTVAAATGAAVAVLDPLEGLAEDGSGDYLSIMRTNLATLRRGQGCT